MSQFRVGDLCVIISPGDKFDGHECTVVGGLSFEVTYPSMKEAWQYPIDIPGEPHHWWAEPWELRLKHPPNKDEFVAGEWELCPWQPKRVTA